MALTKADIQIIREALQPEFSAIQKELGQVREEFRTELGKVRQEFGTELGQVREEFGTELGKVRQEFGTELGQIRQELKTVETNLKAEMAHRFDQVDEGIEKLTQDFTAVTGDLIQDLEKRVERIEKQLRPSS